ncbi:hypothetical protein F4054_12670 [Candidatus Poribacteria bacterium]|nr:hypothetical protein [Candidatus Poribacteria bacterium]MYG06250.1 hypothetical protein [Candidatus Poribacteria bacterium]MYK23095.1 hypothetical protein [Candidatus Poribacteria bacterium]
MTTNKFSLVAEASLDGRLFLARALAHGDTLGRMPREQADALYQSIAAIAHKLITMKTADLSDESALRTQIQTAFTLTSLGLEYGSKGDLDKAAQLLRKTRTVKFFQIGNTLMEKLLDRARHLLEHAVMLPPSRDEERPLGATYTDLEIEGIQIYTQAELEFLKALLIYRTSIRTLQVTIRETDTPRPLLHLAEIEMIDRQLACIEHRCDYVKALPLDNLFALDPPLSIFPNPIEHLTIGLITNLVLYRQVDFQLDEDARQDFHQLAYVDGEIRASFRQQLLDWIAKYLEQVQQPEPVTTYAVAYWDDCLRIEGQAVLS